MTSKPSCCSARHESSTHLCSVCTVMTWRFFGERKRMAPLITALLLSVAPDVKTISAGLALISEAT